MEIKTLFLAFGIGAAVYAVLITFVGLRGRDFPSSRGMLAGLIALGVVLVLGTATFGVKLQIEEQHDRQAGEKNVPGEATTEAASATLIRVPASAI